MQCKLSRGVCVCRLRVFFWVPVRLMHSFGLPKLDFYYTSLVSADMELPPATFVFIHLLNNSLNNTHSLKGCPRCEMPDENNIRPWAWLLRESFTRENPKVTASWKALESARSFQGGLRLRNVLVSVENFIVPFWPKMQVQGLFHTNKTKNSVGNTERL